jgi:hypothetical protein
LTDVVTKTLKGNQLEKFVWFSNHTDWIIWSVTCLFEFQQLLHDERATAFSSTYYRLHVDQRKSLLTSQNYHNITPSTLKIHSLISTLNLSSHSSLPNNILPPTSVFTNLHKKPKINMSNSTQ